MVFQRCGVFCVGFAICDFGVFGDAALLKFSFTCFMLQGFILDERVWSNGGCDVWECVCVLYAKDSS